MMADSADVIEGMRGALERARNALVDVKDVVCGDKFPNWKDDLATTWTRMGIADRCDIEIAAANLALPDSKPDQEGGRG